MGRLPLFLPALPLSVAKPSIHSMVIHFTAILGVHQQFVKAVQLEEPLMLLLFSQLTAMPILLTVTQVQLPVLKTVMNLSKAVINVASIPLMRLASKNAWLDPCLLPEITKSPL